MLLLDMLNAILGLKQNMSNTYDQYGHRIPVTSILAGPNVVLKVGKDKIQLGFGKKKKVKKPQNAYVAIAGYAPRFVREVKVHKLNVDTDSGDKKTEVEHSVGDKVTVSLFQPGDLVKVTGITKGKGFAGGVKRWGFAGGPKTHGQSDRHRAPGSIGQTTTPGRVFKGKKMAGHMGVAQLTITNLEVVEVDESQNKILVKGSIPGAKNGVLIVQKIGKVKGSPPPPKEIREEESKKEIEVSQQQDTPKESKEAAKEPKDNGHEKGEKNAEG